MGERLLYEAIRAVVAQHIELEEFIGPPDAADIAHDVVLVVERLVPNEAQVDELRRAGTGARVWLERLADDEEDAVARDALEELDAALKPFPDPQPEGEAG